MNQTLDIIANRFSCRSYTDRTVEKELLETIALAAVQSPSAMNRQPWRIIVINNKDLINELDAEGMNVLSNKEDKSMYERIVNRGGKLFYNAPCIFLILKKPNANLDIGIVSQNIAIAASSLGLGNVICGMFSIPFSGDKKDYFINKLNITEGWEIGMSVLVGYASEIKKPHEPDLSKINFID